MASVYLSQNKTVEALKKDFNEAFGSKLRVYNGGKVADDGELLSSIGLSHDGTFECRSSLTVATFKERMFEEFGIKVKVYTCDDWVAVLDGMTLESSGKVKKNAVKADMEDMIAYQRSEYTEDKLNGYKIVAEENGGYSIYKNGALCDNAKGAMREIASLMGLEIEPTWTTRQLGAKLLKVINGGTYTVMSAPKATQTTESAQQNDAEKLNAAKAAAQKALEELNKAQAEAEIARQSAEAEATKAQVERAKVEAAAREAAEKAKVELERQKAEAEAAKAELERLKAEAEKVKAEAHAAKAAIEKTQTAAEAAKIAAEKTTHISSKFKDGVLPGIFSIGENKQVHFSMGNLQFHPKKYEWRFAENQYDRIGEDNKNISPNYDGWIDLFGYGTSGYKGVQPTETGSYVVGWLGWDVHDFKDQKYPMQEISNTNYDWGLYNPIINGGNKSGLWRVLLESEWNYLLEKRFEAHELQMRAQVMNVNGLIILPDTFYENRICVPLVKSAKDYCENIFDAEQWSVLENAGAIFLPIHLSQYTHHFYWSSNICIKNVTDESWQGSTQRTEVKAYTMFFSNSLISTTDRCLDFRCFVRLVQDIK